MEQNRKMYGEIIKEHEYRKLIFATVINRFGDSVDAIAFTWLVYQITHSAAWSAIVFALNTLPNVVVQPFAGAIVEKMNKKYVIVATHLLRAVIITLFALLYRAGLVNALVMAIFTLVITTVESFNLPATSAFTMQVVKKEHMTCGMSLNSMLSSAASLAGTGAAGVIIATAGVSTAMMIDVVTFAVAAALIGAMKAGSVAITEAAQNEAFKTTSATGETENKIEQSKIEFFLDGFRYVASSRVICNYGLLAVALNFMLIPINALQAPIASEIFRMGGEILSIAGAFAAIGGIAGSAFVPVLSQKLSPLKMIMFGTSLLAAGMLGMACGGVFAGNNIACYVDVAASFFIMMVAASIIGGTINIQFMKNADPKYIARAAAVMGACGTACMPVGSLLLSAVVTKVSTGAILVFCVIFAIAILAILVFVKPQMELEEGSLGIKNEKVSANLV
ncbi:MFS-type transporter involved in bile tolerance, Atg22 family [Pseudobutyrivibrio sp. OR37]|uniref:MFS transporter n=1 Tax=Pseudobutyrivibrio sp. OR37 TaxID=1798186 RepID=UPI0008F294F3|nr:MFS transporter [Pseudobutyrivibrio sp. OR37]SFI39562.1 MFS-type transporter involved in bile tolerance, Atg22 family [Pseudobutyrivibrio sp. OR37]